MNIPRTIKPLSGNTSRLAPLLLRHKDIRVFSIIYRDNDGIYRIARHEHGEFSESSGSKRKDGNTGIDNNYDCKSWCWRHYRQSENRICQSPAHQLAESAKKVTGFVADRLKDVTFNLIDKAASQASSVSASTQQVWNSINRKGGGVSRDITQGTYNNAKKKGLDMRKVEMCTQWNSSEKSFGGMEETEKRQTANPFRAAHDIACAARQIINATTGRVPKKAH